MSKPSHRISVGDGREHLGDSALKRPPRSRPDGSQGGFDLRPARLDRGEVRQIGRPVDQLRATGFDRWPNRFDSVSAQPVHGDEVSASKRGTEDSFNRDTKHVPLSGSLHGHHRVQSSEAQGSNHRQIRPVVDRHAADRPLARWSPTLQARHCQVDPGFINEIEPFHIQRADLLLIRASRPLDPGGVSFAPVERLLLSWQPQRLQQAAHRRTRHLLLILLLHPLADLVKGQILPLCNDLPDKPSCLVAERWCSAPARWQRIGRSGLTLATNEVLDRGHADPEQLSHFWLGILIRLIPLNDSATQVVRVWSHGS